MKLIIFISFFVVCLAIGPGEEDDYNIKYCTDDNKDFVTDPEWKGNICKKMCVTAECLSLMANKTIEEKNTPITIPVKKDDIKISIENGRVADLKLELDRITVQFNGIGFDESDSNSLCSYDEDEYSITYKVDELDIYFRGYKLSGTILEDIQVNGEGSSRNKLTNFRMKVYVPYRTGGVNLARKPKFDFSIDRSLVIYDGIAEDDVRIFLEEYLSGFSHELVEIIEYYINQSDLLPNLIVAYLQHDLEERDTCPSATDEEGAAMVKGLDEILTETINVMKDLI